MQNSETFPSITLKIDNHTPKIILHKEPSTSGKVVYQFEMGLDTLILQLADKYNLNEELDYIVSAVNQADELFIEFPDFTFESEEEINLSSILNFANKEANSLKPLSTDDVLLNTQLNEYWSADIIASVLEEVYNQLIALTIKFANDLCIEYIKLEDDRSDRRLMEKMAKELAFGEVELIVTNLPPMQDLPETE